MRQGSVRSFASISMVIAAFAAVGAPVVRSQVAPPKKPVPAPAPAPASAPVARAERHLLWHVTAPTGEAYLLGSLRAVPRDIYPLPPEIEKAFHHATHLVVEMDVDAALAEMAKVKEQQGQFAAGDSAAKHMKKETLEALDAFCREHALPAQEIETLRPWFIATEVVESAVLKSLGYDESTSLDRHFIQQAKTKDKKILELETLVERIGVMAGMSENLQERLLTNMLRDVPHQPERLKGMVAAWRSGDLAAIEALIGAKREEPDSKEVWEKLIDYRNVKMTDKIAEYLKDKGPLFVCVGVDHLVGGKGVLKLLEAKGFKVEQVERVPAAKSPAKGP